MVLADCCCCFWPLFVSFSSLAAGFTFTFPSPLPLSLSFGQDPIAPPKQRPKVRAEQPERGPSGALVCTSDREPRERLAACLPSRVSTNGRSSVIIKSLGHPQLVPTRPARLELIRQD